jgi:hypothetical protein
MNVIFIVLYLLRKCCASKYDVYFDTKLPEMHIPCNGSEGSCTLTAKYIIFETTAQIPEVEYGIKYGYLWTNTDIFLRANIQH